MISRERTDINTVLRSIPSMDTLLTTSWAMPFLDSMGREQVKTMLAQAIEEVRRELLSGTFGTALSTAADVAAHTAQRAQTLLCRKAASSLRRVVNASGVIVHTNLGRAPLAADALAAVNAVAASYSTLEYSAEKGGRQGRNTHIDWLISALTGAEDALVVNNNAAAVLLALSACAADREVIVSAGELVEIGDSFRIPDILSFSGAVMTIVGCTNATRAEDYRRAISEKTAVLLKVHPSNYRVEGFTAAVDRKELAELAAAHNLVCIEDLGSGLLCPLNIPFAEREHSVRECIAAGIDVVTFSGDKLLGGPQIGVIAGKKTLIDKMRSHQLYRALRVDKMTLAAFEATLRLYAKGKQQEIPVIRMIETTADALKEKAHHLCMQLTEIAATPNPNSGTAVSSSNFSISVINADSIIGGGAFPTDTLKGFGVSIHANTENTNSVTYNAEHLAASFRNAAIPIITAIKDNHVIIHVRTLLDGDEQIIAKTFAEIVRQ